MYNSNLLQLSVFAPVQNITVPIEDTHTARDQCTGNTHIYPGNQVKTQAAILSCLFSHLKNEQKTVCLK